MRKFIFNETNFYWNTSTVISKKWKCKWNMMQNNIGSKVSITSAGTLIINLGWFGRCSLISIQFIYNLFWTTYRRSWHFPGDQKICHLCKYLLLLIASSLDFLVLAESSWERLWGRSWMLSTKSSHLLIQLEDHFSLFTQSVSFLRE